MFEEKHLIIAHYIQDNKIAELVRLFYQAVMKRVFLVRFGIAVHTSVFIWGVLFVPIFWQSKFSEFSVKLNIVCPWVARLYVFLGISFFMFHWLLT